VLDHVRVVLVSPKTVGNVGAAARLCANFECNDLWVVSPRCDTSGDGATPSSLEAPGW
jgi:tRNA/rRNA methyltransferase